MESTASRKTYVITGATAGIGLASAEILARQGAGLIGIGRSPERCQEAASRLRRLYPDAAIDYIPADLSVQREVFALVDNIQALLNARGVSGLDGLVNNAGTFTYWLTLTPDGIETQWAVNHLAPFLLTYQLLPLLQAAPQARVVTVSSDSHFAGRIHWDDPQIRRRYNCLQAYENTKLANVLFTQELNRRLGALSTVRAFAADPGLVKTDIGLKGNPSIAKWIWKVRRSGGISPQEAAKGIIFLLTEPSIQNAADLYWKHGQPKRASRSALDVQAAGQLWALSEQMCGLNKEVRHVNA